MHGHISPVKAGFSLAILKELAREEEHSSSLSTVFEKL